MPDRWWPQKNSRGSVGRGGVPCRRRFQSPPEACVIYSVWEWTDPTASRADHRSTSRGSLGDVCWDFLLTLSHAHTPLFQAQSRPCSASGFWQGNSVIMIMCLLLSVFPDFDWKVERGVRVFHTRENSTANETFTFICFIFVRPQNQTPDVPQQSVQMSVSIISIH